MNQDVERHKQMIESSGLGLLPGIALAFTLCILVMAGLLVQEWWVMFVVLGSLFAITGAVVWVIIKLLGSDGAEH